MTSNGGATGSLYRVARSGGEYTAPRRDPVHVVQQSIVAEQFYRLRYIRCDKGDSAKSAGSWGRRRWVNYAF